MTEYSSRTNDLLVSLCQLMEEQLAELKHIRAVLGSTSKSSVELKTAGVKAAIGGSVEFSVKAYEDSSIDGPLTEAIAGFRTGINEIEAQQMNGWKETVDMLKDRQP